MDILIFTCIDFFIQGFAKALLDVADNLSRATGAVPEGIAKAKPEEDASGSIKALQALLQGVEMTERQLLQVCLNFPSDFGMKQADVFVPPFIR